MPRPSTPTLRDLIFEAQRKHATTSAPELARIAQRAGHKIVHTTIGQIRTGTYPSKPTQPTLRAIAYLAGVSYAKAYKAAGLGVLPDVTFASGLPDGVDRLRARAREAAYELLRCLVELQDALDAARPAVAPDVSNGESVSYVTDDDIDDPGELGETDETIS